VPGEQKKGGVTLEFDKLREVIARVLSVDPREITEDTTFTEDLGADSLDLFQIMTGVEDVFHIEVPPEETEKINTVGEALQLIRSAVDQKE